MTRIFFSFFLFLSCAVFSVSAHPNHHDPEAPVERVGHEPADLVAEWQFWPNYGLPGKDYKAPNTPEFSAPLPPKTSERLTSERLWFGERATDRRRDLLTMDQLPKGNFSIEFWVSYHVNQPVGAAAIAFDGDRNNDAAWQFGFWQGDAVFTLGETEVIVPAMELKSSIVQQDLDTKPYQRGVTRYWHHLVGVYDRKTLSIYHQGELRDSIRLDAPLKPYTDSTEFEIASYLGHEPHMSLGNLVKRAALYDRALAPKDIALRFDDHRELVEKGIHFRDLFHFTTGAPHLSMPTTSSINISWETDRPAEAIVEYGLDSSLGRSIKLEANGNRTQSVKIENLKANTGYYYRVKAVDENGTELDSGVLSFRTAVEKGDPVIFAALSDTEARPHVNAHLANLIWEESPHLIVNAGDLTDGGRHDHRAEWTHEYFASMGHLMARTPFLPVMGNGENDFVWFDRYHLTTAPEVSYYNFQYGDVEFFVLDSNLDKREEEDPGFRDRQRDWLERSLKRSKARWKVATHHHPLLQDRYPLIVSDFVDLYEKYGVDMVLVGHHHNYLRSWPLKKDTPNLDQGITYVQLGGGGGNLGSRPRTPDLRWAKTYQGYGYSIISILDDRLDYKMYDDKGAMRDSFALVKRGTGPAKLEGAR